MLGPILTDILDSDDVLQHEHLAPAMPHSVFPHHKVVVHEIIRDIAQGQ